MNQRDFIFWTYHFLRAIRKRLPDRATRKKLGFAQFQNVGYAQEFLDDLDKYIARAQALQKKKPLENERAGE